MPVRGYWPASAWVDETEHEDLYDFPCLHGCLLPTNVIAVADELRPEDGASFEGVATETG